MENKRILAVEDNLDNMELVRFLLNKAGYEVLAADNGKDALETAQRELPDLILLDLAIPEMDGWAVARTLKADEKTRFIPVIALTACTTPNDRLRAFEAGCEGFIAKPMNVVEFVNEIEFFIERSLGKRGIVR
jgi:two-component system cell cycle response regulator DivK